MQQFTINFIHQFRLTFFVFIILANAFQSILQMFPCIFALLSDRKRATYELLFSIIEQKFHLNPIRAWVDYERALREGMKTTYPQMIIRAFWFQFCLAIRRKSKTIPQLFESLWQNANANVLYHKLLALPLLPATDINNAFNTLKVEAQKFDFLTVIFEYVEKIFIERETIENFAIERKLFSKNCSSNFNETLKKQFFVKAKDNSLIDLLSILRSNLLMATKLYESPHYAPKKLTTRQISLVSKAYDTFLANREEIEPQGFLSKITFRDNTGAITNLCNYLLGDEHEFDDNDEGPYEYPQVIHIK